MPTITEQQALEYHEYPRPGKIEVIPTKPYSTQKDLALAYSPGVAFPCLKIQEHPDDAYRYTDKGNLVAVVSNGTAVLGLGDIGALSGKPVMEGKALLFKIFAGLDCFDIEVDEKDPDKFIDIVRALTPTFGGINLEDIKAPECFKIEEELKQRCNIPVMHDDQHGTAIISGAGLINALKIQGKKIEDVKLVVNGAGAAAVSCTKLYIALGVKKENVVMCDSKGVITTRRQGLNPQKAQFATDRDITTLAQAMQGADVFLGLSVKDVVTPEMVQSMAPRPIVFALANPDPEIEYDKAITSRPDVIVATGRSDYPNQINNVLGFPYIFRGALDCGATAINEEMKIRACHAIAELAREPVPQVVTAAYNQTHLEFGRDYILPKPLDPRLLTSVAPAVAHGAIDSGIAQRPITDWEEYDEKLRRLKGLDKKLMRGLTDAAKQSGLKRIVLAEGNTDNMLRAAAMAASDGLARPVLLGNQEMIEKRAHRLGVDLQGVEIVNPRHPSAAEARDRYARDLARRRQRQGVTLSDARELMMNRDYFGMMMVQQGDADAFIAGTRSAAHSTAEIAKQVVGLRPGYDHFATMHVFETRRGTLFLADTMINGDADADTLTDVARLTRNAVRFFASEPVMAVVSQGNFGNSDDPDSKRGAQVVERMQNEFPDLAIDGEMQVHYAFNKELRDQVFPFTKLRGKEVNTLIFPNLAAANIALRLLLEMGVGEAIGPIQLGLNKPVHFIAVDSPVRDIINLMTVAAVDAAVLDHNDARGGE